MNILKIALVVVLLQVTTNKVSGGLCGVCTTSSQSSENSGSCRPCPAANGDACLNSAGGKRTSCADSLPTNSQDL